MYPSFLWMDDDKHYQVCTYYTPPSVTPSGFCFVFQFWRYKINVDYPAAACIVCVSWWLNLLIVLTAILPSHVLYVEIINRDTVCTYTLYTYAMYTYNHIHIPYTPKLTNTINRVFFSCLWIVFQASAAGTVVGWVGAEPRNPSWPSGHQVGHGFLPEPGAWT